MAILAVAPLLLFPFLSNDSMAVVLLWLSLFSMTWVILEPSIRTGERVYDARLRVLRAIVCDPIFWTSFVVCIFFGVSALNTGVSVAYNAETSLWYLSPAYFSIFPGSVKGAGFLPFTVMLSVTILFQGCCHALGRSARMAFLALLSTFSGLAAVLALIMAQIGNETVLRATQFLKTDFSFVGMAFGVSLLCGVVAFFLVFENRWRKFIPFFILALGGSTVGLFYFSPAYMLVACLGLIILMMGYVFLYARKVLPITGEFRWLVSLLVFMSAGGLLAALMLPEEFLTTQIDKVMEFSLLPNEFWDVRKVLSSVSFKAWVSHLWIGIGLGAFPYSVRFFAQPDDWTLLPQGADSISNGWWMILVEHGVVGAFLIVVLVGLLVYFYCYRLVIWFRSNGFSLPHPTCLLAPIIIVAVVAGGFFDCSFLRADVLPIIFSIIAVSIASFSSTMGGQ